LNLAIFSSRYTGNWCVSSRQLLFAMPVSSTHFRGPCGLFVLIIARGRGNLKQNYKAANIRVLPKFVNTIRNVDNLDFIVPGAFPSIKSIFFKRIEVSKRSRENFGVITASFLIFLSCCLLRAGDVEANPGPTPNDTDQSASALTSQFQNTRSQHSTGTRDTVTNNTTFRTFNKQYTMNDKTMGRSHGSDRMRESLPFERMFHSLSSKLDDARNTTHTSLSSITSKIDQMATTMNDNYRTLRQDLGHLKRDVTAAQQQIGANKCEIDRLIQVNERTNQLVFSLQEEVDKLASHSRRNNLKFFGVAESGEQESYDKCRDTILNILNEFVVDKAWYPNDIDRAHRLGRKKNSSHPRPIIVRFHRWADAMKVLNNKEARDYMRAAGLRVASDLTPSQTEKLREMKKQGQIAFYRSGKLHTKSRNAEQNNGHQNCFKDQNNDGQNVYRNRRHNDRQRGYRNEQNNDRQQAYRDEQNFDRHHGYRNEQNNDRQHAYSNGQNNDRHQAYRNEQNNDRQHVYSNGQNNDQQRAYRNGQNNDRQHVHSNEEQKNDDWHDWDWDPFAGYVGDDYDKYVAGGCNEEEYQQFDRGGYQKKNQDGPPSSERDNSSRAPAMSSMTDFPLLPAHHRDSPVTQNPPPHIPSSAPQVNNTAIPHGSTLADNPEATGRDAEGSGANGIISAVTEVDANSVAEDEGDVAAGNGSVGSARDADDMHPANTGDCHPLSQRSPTSSGRYRTRSQTATRQTHLTTWATHGSARTSTCQPLSIQTLDGQQQPPGTSTST